MIPAYGRDLLEIRRKGYAPAWVVIALNFKLGKAMPRVCVPVDVQVAELDLRCVAGLDCLIAHENEKRRALDIAELALRHGATKATIHDQCDDETFTTDEVKAIRGIA